MCRHNLKGIISICFYLAVFGFVKGTEEACWHSFGGNQFILVTHYGGVEFHHAVELCHTLNASIASIHSKEEDEFLDRVRQDVICSQGNLSKMQTSVESSSIASRMLFNPDCPMYMKASWAITKITATAIWKRRIYVDRQGCLKRVLLYGPDVRRSLRRRRPVKRAAQVGVPVWIGLRVNDSNFYWEDGSEMDYVNKETKMPVKTKTKSGSCVYIFYSWMPGSCDNYALYFVCKRSGSNHDNVCVTQTTATSAIKWKDLTTLAKGETMTIHNVTITQVSSASIPRTITEVSSASIPKPNHTGESIYDRGITSPPEIPATTTVMPSSGRENTTPNLLSGSNERQSTTTTMRSNGQGNISPNSSIVQIEIPRSTAATLSSGRENTSPNLSPASTAMQSISTAMTSTGGDKTSTNLSPFSTAMQSTKTDMEKSTSEEKVVTSTTKSPKVEVDKETRQPPVIQSFEELLDEMTVKEKPKYNIKEAPNSIPIGTTAVVFLVIIMVGIILLDINTIRRHLLMLMENTKGVCGRHDDNTFPA